MNKLIVISGAGRGLGLELVKRHLALQDTVYAFTQNPNDTLREMEKKNSGLKVYRCDVTKESDLVESSKDILADGKRIDILYYVAGIFKFEGRVDIGETDIDDCLLMFDVNALGTIRVCKVLCPLLLKDSLVVNISSEAGSIGGMRRTQEYGYSMSKAALNMGSKILSNALWERGGRVFVLHPGWMRTDMGGPASFKSDRSILPETSADNIINLVSAIDKIPRDQMYMRHTGEILPW
jgi:NAD(P)-dependent dehydrogenase (short-subunit alcohol dehydrogenase family)